VQFVVVLVLAFAPGIFWLWMVYRRDRYRPEPRALVVRTFLWGMVVAVPVALLEFVLVFLVDPGAIDAIQDGPLSLATAAYVSFVAAGVTEELGKYIVVRRTVYHSPYFDEPMDGIVYASAAALGFASLENLGYLLAFGWETILVRGPVSTLAHVLFSVMWGYPLGLSKATKGGLRTWVWLGVIGAMVAHGLFDFLLFIEGVYSYLTIPLFLAAGASFVLMMRRAQRLSPYREMIGDLLVGCPDCGIKVPYHADFCTSCGVSLREARRNASVFCGKCGAALNHGVEYCTSCGSRLLRKPPR